MNKSMAVSKQLILILCVAIIILITSGCDDTSVDGTDVTFRNEIIKGNLTLLQDIDGYSNILEELYAQTFDDLDIAISYSYVDPDNGVFLIGLIALNDESDIIQYHLSSPDKTPSFITQSFEQVITDETECRIAIRTEQNRIERIYELNVETDDPFMGGTMHVKTKRIDGSIYNFEFMYGGGVRTLNRLAAIFEMCTH